ncbi:transmembrane protein [Perilla frutescens var. hirtella]|nr:transmembrane protein [Perilla frutescens var. hirtella]KAH6811356.1 transmembrane protein [Perilla frutescens var. frutescens]
MADWGPVFVAVVLFVLLSPGLLIQVPGRNRFVEFGNFQTSGVSILVHAPLWTKISLYVQGLRATRRGIFSIPFRDFDGVKTIFNGYFDPVFSLSLFDRGLSLLDLWTSRNKFFKPLNGRVPSSWAYAEIEPLQLALHYLILVLQGSGNEFRSFNHYFDLSLRFRF